MDNQLVVWLPNSQVRQYCIQVFSALVIGGICAATLCGCLSCFQLKKTKTRRARARWKWATHRIHRLLFLRKLWASLGHWLQREEQLALTQHLRAKRSQSPHRERLVSTKRLEKPKEALQRRRPLQEVVQEAAQQCNNGSF